MCKKAKIGLARIFSINTFFYKSPISLYMPGMQYKTYSKENFW